MNFKKIFSAAALSLFTVSGIFSQSDEEIRQVFQDTISNVSSPIQKKQLEQAMNTVLSVKDPAARSAIYKAMKDSLGIVEKNKKSGNSSSTQSSSTTKKTEDSVKIIPANLANSKTRGAELQKIISSHIFKGEGSRENPVLISHDWELVAVAACSSSGDDRFDSIKLSGGTKEMPQNLHFKLTGDLDFAENNISWDVPIGGFHKDTGSFTKSFDGNGFAIKNLKGTVPLFRYISIDGLVRNLRIENSVIKISSEQYENSSPFCKNLEGVLINCTFNGEISGKRIYDFGYSSDGRGYAVGCVSINKNISDSSKNLRTLACVTKNSTDQAASLNKSLSAWNSLYSTKKEYLSACHFESKDGKVNLVSGEPEKISSSVANAKHSIFGSTFTHAAGFTVARDNYFVTKYVYLSDPVFPEGSDITHWTSESYVSLTPTGKRITVSGHQVPTYNLKHVTKDLRGRFNQVELDRGNAYIKEAFSDGEKKGLYICYDGGSKYMMLLTAEAEKSYETIKTDLGNIYGLKVPFSTWVEYPSSIYIGSLISSGKW